MIEGYKASYTIRWMWNQNRIHLECDSKWDICGDVGFENVPR